MGETPETRDVGGSASYNQSSIAPIGHRLETKW